MAVNITHDGKPRMEPVEWTEPSFGDLYDGFLATGPDRWSLESAARLLGLAPLDVVESPPDEREPFPDGDQLPIPFPHAGGAAA